MQAGIPGVHRALPLRHRGICNVVHAQQKAVSPQVLSCGPWQLNNIGVSLPSRPAIKLNGSTDDGRFLMRAASTLLAERYSSLLLLLSSISFQT